MSLHLAPRLGEFSKSTLKNENRCKLVKRFSIKTPLQKPEILKKHQWKTTELYSSYKAEKGYHKQECHSSDRKTGEERRRHCCLKLAAFRCLVHLKWSLNQHDN